VEIHSCLNFNYEGVDKPMIYVGIDIASQKHDCAILDRNGKELCGVFEFENNRAEQVV